MNTITLRTLRNAQTLHRSLKPYASHHVLSTPFLTLHRHHSSSPTTTLLKTQDSPPTHRHPVNGPLSTLPPPLDLPVLPPNTSKYAPKYLFNLGKTYALFYKTAVLNIWHNRNAVIELRLALPDKYKGSVLAAAKENAVSRSDFQLWARTRRDMRKVPLFALLFLVCGEFTPLIVVALSGIVPPSAWIPKQVEGYRQALEQRRRESFRNLMAKVEGEKKDAYKVENLHREMLLHVGRSVGLFSNLWERVGGPPMWLLQRRVREWEEYLRVDGRLIKKGGRVEKMEAEEVLRACVERGLDVLNQSEVQRRKVLDAFLAQGGVPLLKLLLTRPSVWDEKPDFLIPTKSRKN